MHVLQSQPPELTTNAPWNTGHLAVIMYRFSVPTGLWKAIKRARRECGKRMRTCGVPARSTYTFDATSFLMSMRLSTIPTVDGRSAAMGAMHAPARTAYDCGVLTGNLPRWGCRLEPGRKRGFCDTYRSHIMHPKEKTCVLGPCTPLSLRSGDQYACGTAQAPTMFTIFSVLRTWR